MGRNGKVDLTLSESWPEAGRSPQENLLRDNPIIPENPADPPNMRRQSRIFAPDRVDQHCLGR